jgi:hypothetical protein
MSKEGARGEPAEGFSMVVSIILLTVRALWICCKNFGGAKRG